MRRFFWCLMLGCGTLFTQAQVIHSHNDYQQKMPFYEAFAHGARSIEVDVFNRNGTIVVAHDKVEIATAPTFEKLYVDPMLEMLSRGKELKFMMPIDLKTSAEKTLDPLVAILKKYPQIFNENNVTVCITGSRPSADNFLKYPDFVTFDGRPDEQYTDEQLKKIGMISDGISQYTTWNGKGSIIPEQKAKMQAAIDAAHAKGKQFRFWGAKDNVNTWMTLYLMGVDIINTDKVAECTNFFSSFQKKHYTLPGQQPTYKPTYASDGKEGRVKNVIFLIGDGTSTNQYCAAETANRGELTVLNMRNIGFQTTQALNSYNTDSAGAGSALGSGKKTNNRHISTTPTGENNENAAEKFAAQGKRVGVISSGDITDATPAAFYAHSVERDNSEEIAAWVTKEKLWLLAGSNQESFKKRKDGRNITNELKAKGYNVTYSMGDLANKGKVICLDEKFGDRTTESNIGWLGRVTADAIGNLENPDGFLLMVESAKIDYAGHANNLGYSVLETLAFDAAIAEALKFADENGETLVVVTGDHETGGLVLLEGDRESGTVYGCYVSDDHTGVMLPVFAYGVGAQDFRGVYKNEDILRKIVELTKK